MELLGHKIEVYEIARISDKKDSTMIEEKRKKILRKIEKGA